MNTGGSADSCLLAIASELLDSYPVEKQPAPEPDVPGYLAHQPEA